MRQLKTIVMLLVIGSVPLAAQDAEIKSSRLAAADVTKELKESSGVSNAVAVAEPESPFIDPLGRMGELPPAVEVDADILEDENQIDAQAKDLAAQVLGGAESALPPLIAALQLSGLHIRHGSRELFSPAGKSQGLIIQASDVQSMARLARMGFTVALPDAAAWISGVAKDKAPTRLETVLLESIRRRAAFKSGPMRFWGRFIVELGRQSQLHPVDLLSQGTLPSSVQLDAVQLTLVLSRFGGDLWASAQPKRKAAKSISLPGSFDSNTFRNSFFPGNSNSFSGIQSSPASPTPSGAPCDVNEIDGTVGDGEALVRSFLQGKFSDWFFDKFPNISPGTAKTISGITSGLGYANVALAYLKLAMAYAAFDIEFSMESPAPLVRTKTTKAGEQKQIRMRALMRSDKTDFINCLRPYLNGLGIDFNVEKAGAIGGSTVVWRIRSGADMVRFFGGDIVHGRTDENGYASVGIEGLPQKKDLPKIAKKITRRALVGAQVDIKPTRMKQDAVDSLAVLTGGLAGLATIPAEILYRTGFGFERGYGFDVTDWTEKLKFTMDSTFTENGRCADVILEIKGRYKAELVLEPNCDENDTDCDEYYGTGNMEVVHLWKHDQRGALCNIWPQNQPLKVDYSGDTREIMISFGSDTDKWECSPGARGESWWWSKFLLSHVQDGRPIKNEFWYTWVSEQSPPAGMVARKMFGETSVAFSCNFVSEDTRIEIRTIE